MARPPAPAPAMTLLTAALETADGKGLAAFLETDVDRNVGIYERFGFVTISRHHILGIDNRFMWREPRLGPFVVRIPQE